MPPPAAASLSAASDPLVGFRAAAFADEARSSGRRESADRVTELNRTHDMAGMRARGGRLVRAIEERRRRLVASRVLRCSPRVVVDVGCEDGWIAEAYAAPGRETVLVDLDPAMLERAAAKGLPGVRTLVGAATDPTLLPPGTADVLVLSAILEHVEEPWRVLQAMVPVLRPPGRVVAYVPADGPILVAKGILRWTGLSRLVPGVSLDPAPGHVRRFDRAQFARLLAPFGVIEEIEFDPAVLGYAATVRVG